VGNQCLSLICVRFAAPPFKQGDQVIEAIFLKWQYGFAQASGPRE
jgi:hypothetical protein